MNSVINGITKAKLHFCLKIWSLTFQLVVWDSFLKFSAIAIILDIFVSVRLKVILSLEVKGNTRTEFEKCLKWTIKTPEQR